MNYNHTKTYNVHVHIGHVLSNINYGLLLLIKYSIVCFFVELGYRYMYIMYVTVMTITILYIPFSFFICNYVCMNNFVTCIISF